jgi:hypothetical protein
MKYLKRFESNVYKEPLDVDLDIEKFWGLFGEKIKSYDIKRPPSKQEWSKEYQIKSMVNKMSDEFGVTMTDDWNYYNVYNADDYGKNIGDIMVVKAVNNQHAKLKVATIKNNLEIFSTGFYLAKKVDLDKEILDTENQIKSLQKKLNELNNIP